MLTLRGETNSLRLLMFIAALDVIAAGPVSAVPETPVVTVPRWEMHEFEVHGRSHVDNPFRDAALVGEFTSPSGKAITAEGFFDGGDIWRLRFAPDEEGEWRYLLRGEGVELHQQGRLRCVAPVGHGFIRIHPDNPYAFAYADGVPFFPMGDTCYGLHDDSSITPGLRSEYLETRSRQRFNFVRMSVGHSHYRAQADPTFWAWGGTPQQPDLDRLNPAFFKSLDGLLSQMRQCGMNAELLLLNFYRLPFTDTKLWTPARERLWLRYVIARYAAFGNIFLWTLANEYETHPDGSYRLDQPGDVQWAKATARRVKQLDPYHHPVTVHPVISSSTRGTSPRDPYEPPWRIGDSFGEGDELDVLSQQTAQAGAGVVWDEHSQCWTGDDPELVASLHVDRRYRKPVLNTENGYEYLRGQPTEKKQVHHTDKVRRSAWRIVCAGGYFAAGFNGTIGHNDIWNRIDAPNHYTFIVKDEGAAAQLGLLYDFFASLPFWRMQPLAGVTPDTAVGLAEPGRTYVVYLPQGGEVTVDLSEVSGTLAVEWFNPRTGATLNGGAVSGAARCTFRAPFEGDAVLRCVRAAPTHEAIPHVRDPGVDAMLRRLTADRRLRVLIETDAGGDPDDEQSLVRFLLYANEWDIEGIIANRPATRRPENKNPEETGLGIVRSLLNAYGECRSSLTQHDARYPTKESLWRRTVAGYSDTNDAVKLICAAVDKDDPRPLWYSDWGTDSGAAVNNLQRALDLVQRERGQQGYARFKSRLRLSSADNFGDHTTTSAPPFAIWVNTFEPPVEGKRWYHRFSALTSKAGGFDLTRDVLTNHGPLGALYPTNTTHWAKEGDTMTFLYLVPTGMNDPNEPLWGSWAGRYGRNDGFAGKRYYWANSADTWNGTTHRDNTLARWASDLQNDFRARLDWCVKPPDKANHAPHAVVNGIDGREILHVRARPGQAVSLDAGLSRDPDGDKLAFEWFIYHEAGTYEGEVTLTSALSPLALLRVPEAAADRILHVVLAVRDSGTPPLAAYRRVVVEVLGEPASASAPMEGAGSPSYFPPPESQGGWRKFDDPASHLPASGPGGTEWDSCYRSFIQSEQNALYKGLPSYAEAARKIMADAARDPANLAKPESPDPIERLSSRLSCFVWSPARCPAGSWD